MRPTRTVVSRWHRGLAAAAGSAAVPPGVGRGSRRPSPPGPQQARPTPGRWHTGGTRTLARGGPRRPCPARDPRRHSLRVPVSGGLWAPERRALTIGLVLTVTLVAFEALAVITILPAIKDDLGGLRLYGWVTSAFFLGVLVGVVVAGEQTDRRGPAPPFVAAVVLFGIGLVIGGLAPTMLVLVIARGLQGLGAGAISTVTYTSIGRCFPEELRPRLLAVTSTAWVVPGIAGPALSALVASHFGWRVVFLGLLPLVVFSASLTIGSLRRIGPPAEPAPHATGLVDAVRVATGTGLLLAGLTQLTGGSPAVGVALAVAGVVLGLRALVRLLPAGTLRARPGLPVAVLSRGLLTFAFFGADTYVPLTITAVRGQ